MILNGWNAHWLFIIVYSFQSRYFLFLAEYKWKQTLSMHCKQQTTIRRPLNAPYWEKGQPDKNDAIDTRSSSHGPFTSIVLSLAEAVPMESTEKALTMSISDRSRFAPHEICDASNWYHSLHCAPHFTNKLFVWQIPHSKKGQPGWSGYQGMALQTGRGHNQAVEKTLVHPVGVLPLLLQRYADLWHAVTIAWTAIGKKHNLMSYSFWLQIWPDVKPVHFDRTCCWFGGKLVRLVVSWRIQTCGV